MAPPVFSTRFLAVHDAAVAVPNDYVVPDGFVAVVRDMDAFFGMALGERTVEAFGSALQVFWQDTVGLGESGWRSWRGRQVLYAGETLRMIVIGDVGDITASGYLLSA